MRNFRNKIHLHIIKDPLKFIFALLNKINRFIHPPPPLPAIGIYLAWHLKYLVYFRNKSDDNSSLKYSLS